mmetsp:Transcript_25735/g.50275  ORF Transcript_25735/g.50275 Transcript_25735/m.50275 type:complete len:237 (-) Transcript_25735:709-1419(-)
MPSSTSWGGCTQRSRQLMSTLPPLDPIGVWLRLSLLRFAQRGTASAMYTAPSSPTSVPDKSKSTKALQCGIAPAKYRAPVSPIALFDRFRTLSDTGSPHASFHAPSTSTLFPLRSSLVRLVHLGSAFAKTVPASQSVCVLPRCSSCSFAHLGSAAASSVMPGMPSMFCERSRTARSSQFGRIFASRPTPSGPMPTSAIIRALRLAGRAATMTHVPSSPSAFLLRTSVSSTLHPFST